MRIYAAGLLHETLTFVNELSTIDDFKTCYFRRDGKHDTPVDYCALALTTWADLAKNKHRYTESLATGAMPSAPLNQKNYETIRDEIVDKLAFENRHEAIDIVLLNLHGAMIAQHCLDCEGDLIERVRGIVGDKTIIGVICDLHAHLSTQMIENANLILFYREYPHTDVAEVATELFELAIMTADQQIKPKMLAFDCHMITLLMTKQSPMQDIVKAMRAQDGQNGILKTTICHGFPYGDTPDIGTKILVIYDQNINHAEQQAQQFSEALGLMLYQTRHEIKPHVETIAVALAQVTDDGIPTIFADFADNPGGGSHGRSTFILHELLKQQIKNVAFSSICDPDIVKALLQNEIDSIHRIRLGGAKKPVDEYFDGLPLDVEVKLIGVYKNYSQHFVNSYCPMGDMIGIKIIRYYPPDSLTQAINSDLDVVINSIKCQTFNPDCFSVVNIVPETKKILVVKSMFHYRAEFSNLSHKFYSIQSSGILNPNIDELPYKNLQPNKSMWPLEDEISEFELKIKSSNLNPYFEALRRIISSRS